MSGHTPAEGFSEACCRLPPVEAEYTPKGEWIEIRGLKTYHTGSKSAKAAIILIYDVFGFGPQIIQGADVLARAEGGPQPFQVFMPDAQEGKYASAKFFDGSEEGNKLKGQLFGPGGGANMGRMIGNVAKVVEALKTGEFGGVEKLGIVGYCWGGKIVSMVSKEGTAFAAAAQCHPSAMAKEDGSAIAIPTAILASSNEDKDVMQGFIDNVKGPKLLEFFNDVPHGWMAARGDFVNDPGKRDFVKGYTILADFFSYYLSK